MPIAFASNGRVCPSTEAIAPSWYRCPLLGGQVIATPPASAMSQSRERRLAIAMVAATSDVEHAVLTLIAGPESPSLCATRLVR